MEYAQIKTNLNVSEMENMYDEVTIETVSHRTLQKSVYSQQICNTYFTNDQNIFFPPPMKQYGCLLK